jgi:glycerol-3-phosphate dehydrogenase (NAD(P)+)
MHVVIIGSGAWGTTLAGLADRAGSRVTLLARNESVFRSLRDTRRHPVSVPGYVLPAAVDVDRDAGAVLAGEVDIVVVVVPSVAIDNVAETIAGSRYRGPVVTATKGIDPETLLTSSERLSRVLADRCPIVALSGPNLAAEIAAGQPAAAVVAGEDQEVLHLARQALMSETYRIYTSRDVTGVEIAGALKNVIAIGAGIADGLGAGQNAKAAYMTRGIAEMARLGVALGANPLTFAGLAGIGDLIATCSSERSRNHTVGRGLAQGKPLRDVLSALPEVAEGVPTARAALRLGTSHGVELPITAQIARVMFDEVSPAEAIVALMARDATEELNFLS